MQSWKAKNKETLLLKDEIRNKNLFNHNLAIVLFFLLQCFVF